MRKSSSILCPLPLCTADKLDPDKLMEISKRAKAHYLFAQDIHHDSFDPWDGKYQPGNSGNNGPHRSILAGWKEVADKEGMRFGIAFRRDYSNWFQPTFLRDLDGPNKDVPHDGGQNYD